MPSARQPCKLTSQRKERAQPLIAQVKPSPEQRANDDREEEGKQAIADAHVRSDCAAQIARQLEADRKVYLTLVVTVLYPPPGHTQPPVSVLPSLLNVPL